MFLRRMAAVDAAGRQDCIFQPDPSTPQLMALVRDVVDFLQERDLIVRSNRATAGSPDAEVTNVRADRDAGPADLAWMSQKVLDAQPERAEQFKGALLIGPPGLPVPDDCASVRIASQEPKLAFTLVVEQFFGNLVETEWPMGAASIHPSAVISPDAVLCAGVVIGSGTVVGPHAWIGPNSCIANTTIGAHVRIGAGCAIGLPGFGLERGADGQWRRFPHLGRVVIEDGVQVGSNTCVDRGALTDTRIRAGAHVDNLVHVAHNVDIGENALVIANAMLGGSVRIGRDAWIAPSVSVLNQVTIGDRATLGLGAVVIRDVLEDSTVVGNPAKPLK